MNQNIIGLYCNTENNSNNIYYLLSQTLTDILFYYLDTGFLVLALTSKKCITPYIYI